MKLIPDAARVMTRAYSWWAMMAMFVLIVAPDAIFVALGRDLDPMLIGRLALFFAIFGTLGRIVDQDGPGLWRLVRLIGISAALTAAIVLALSMPARAMDQVQPDPPPAVAEQGLPTWPQTATFAVPLVKQWEGLELTAYLDTIASPPVWTICHGETQGVRPGETRTEAQCEAGLRDGLRVYWSRYRADLTLASLAAETDAAFTSLAWNIGNGALSRSTALRRLNAEDIAGACEALTWWNRAGGRVVRGLVNRRGAEFDLCIAGVPS